MVYLIFKGSGWAGKSIPIETKPKKIEQTLSEHIDKGTVTTRDIAEIVNSGDRGLKEKLEKEANRKYKQKEDLHRVYGKDVDGIDRQGQIYKDIPVDTKDFGF